MTDYSKMNHQTLYNYAHSGNPDAMNSTATAWQNHSQALEQATSELQTNLTAIQSQWEGAAADAYFQQSQDVATKMQTHADNAANTSTAVTNTANALTWARKNMPDPPSWLEQKTASIDSNIVTGAIGFLTTDGAATVASEMAKHDIANKHQQAISTMTQLAAAYTSAESQLPSTLGSGHWDDPNNGNGNGTGNGSGTTPVAMPVPIYPMGATGGGGAVGNAYPGGIGSGGHPGGEGVGGVGVGGGIGSGSGGGSTRGGSGVKVPSFTNPGGDTFTQGTGAVGSTSTGGVGGSPNPFGVPSESASGFGSRAGQYGSGIGSGSAAGFGAMSAGVGAIGAEGSGESGGYGSGGYGARKLGTAAGGTDLGAGEGSGIWGGEGSGGTSGRYGSAAGVAGGSEAATGGAEGAQGEQGMMGGMGGRGGAGGSGEERGNRAGFLRQDPDYWYGDKQAAPPGGVIE